MVTRHSGAANRLSPSAIADAALAWPPPVSEVMIRNFLVGSLVIDSSLQSSSRGVLLILLDGAVLKSGRYQGIIPFQSRHKRQNPATSQGERGSHYSVLLAASRQEP